MGKRLLTKGTAFSRAEKDCPIRALQAAEKLASLKGTAFRPYIIAV
jgi:hypothetical protein